MLSWHERRSIKDATNIPVVNLVKDQISLGLAVFTLEILAYPLNKVIFEYSLHELVEKIQDY